MSESENTPANDGKRTDDAPGEGEKPREDSDAPREGEKPREGNGETDWQAHARLWEKRARENEDAKKRLAELERANESQQEKLARERDEARTAAESSAVELARMRAGVRYGLTEDDLELLGNGSPDEIDERAKRLAERLGAAAKKPPASRRPAEHLRGGTEPEREPEETDLTKLGARMFKH